MSIHYWNRKGAVDVLFVSVYNRIDIKNSSVWNLSLMNPSLRSKWSIINILAPFNKLERLGDKQIYVSLHECHWIQYPSDILNLPHYVHFDNIITCRIPFGTFSQMVIIIVIVDSSYIFLHILVLECLVTSTLTDVLKGISTTLFTRVWTTEFCCRYRELEY